MPTFASLDTAQLLALAAALGWASGLRLYLVVLLTGLAGFLGWVPLPSGLELLANPVVLTASGLMVAVEFFADKIPGLDSVWDVVHTVIRVPAGGALAAGAVTGLAGDSAAWPLIASILGGTLAATSHAAKASSRAALNTSPEPVSNVAASLAEETAVTGGLWLAVHYPLTFACVLLGVLVLSVWLIVKCVRFLRGLFSWVSKTAEAKPPTV